MINRHTTLKHLIKTVTLQEEIFRTVTMENSHEGKTQFSIRTHNLQTTAQTL